MKRGFLYFFKKSISQRKGRVVIASLSVMLAVAIVTGLAGITSGIKEKLGSELQAYGANLLVSPGDQDLLDIDALKVISELESVAQASGQIYGRAFIKDDSVEVIGLDMGGVRESGWRLDGSWPQNDREIVAGINLKEVLELETGKTITLSSESGKSLPLSSLEKDEIRSRKHSMKLIVSGFIERGGSEDNAFIMSLDQAWSIMGVKNKLSAILVRGKSGDLDTISSRIINAFTGVKVKTLRQVAVAEESLLRKIQLLMTLVTVVVFFAAIVSIMSTMGANVLERREEIGLMKAIGATRNRIRSFYFAEAVLTGLAGGVSGFCLGYLFTQAVSWGAFHALIGIPSYLFILSVAAGLIVSLIASHFPVDNALKYNPAVILREE
jgi:putative ABC transport system permease protein